MAVSSKDIETLWKRYSSEASKRGVSVIQFFESNGVPYHVFEKWYKKKFAQPAVVNCVVKETLDVASQPSTENKVEETDSTAGAADVRILTGKMKEGTAYVFTSKANSNMR